VIICSPSSRRACPTYGLLAVGEGKDSPGSEALIRAIDRDDPRPLWVPVWGGPNVLGQALWKIRATRSADAVAKAVAKLRVYAISDQDDTGPWLRKEFPACSTSSAPASALVEPTTTRRGAG